MSQILKEALAKKAKRNKSYSTRAFARDLKVSASFLSQVMSGKRHLSLDRAKQITEVLKDDIDARLAKRLLEAVALTAVSKNKSIEDLRATVDRSEATLTYSNIDADQFQFFNHWYHIAILDLTTCADFESNIEWIATRLGLDMATTSSAIERLNRLGLLHQTNGILRKTNLHVSVPTSRGGDNALRNFHGQMIEKAKEALHPSEPEELKRRHISGITMAIDSSRHEEALKRIAQFKRDMAELLTEGPSDEVVQLNIQFFPLTKMRGKT